MTNKRYKVFKFQSVIEHETITIFNHELQKFLCMQKRFTTLKSGDSASE